MRNCMVIPTYWSVRSAAQRNVFDHPTDLDGPETLSRTLDNLDGLEYPDRVVLFPTPMDPVVEAMVKKIAAGRRIDIRVFGQKELDLMHSILAAEGFPKECLDTIAPDSYGGIRNLGLLYADLCGFENIVMIDDDELIDENYHSMALAHMGEAQCGHKVLGKTGCVLDAKGNKYYEGQVNAEFENWPKDSLFNENVKKALGAPKKLSACEIAFGGNMVLNREMYLRVPFDPYGSRGEDDDYVLNARHCGLPFFFDQDLLLLHLPPERKDGFWKRQRQDIIRFKYAREKARVYGFDSHSLGVFFEYFTQADLEYKAVSSSICAARRFLDTDRAESMEFMNNAIVAERLSSKDLLSRAEAFMSFMDAWEEVMPKLWNKGTIEG
jgi:hypothetical protein